MLKIQLDTIAKTYKEKNNENVQALQQISLQIEEGEKVIIVGESGAGKSTLLNIISLLDYEYDGTYLLNGNDASSLKQNEIARLRNEEFGFIFQDYILVEDNTVYENIEIPLLYSKKFSRHERNTRIKEALSIVQLEECINKKARNLSGGQRQRVAIARALVNQPNTLILDEPTGALNRELSSEIMHYIYEYIEQNKKTMIMVTHDIEKVKGNNCRVLTLESGFIKSDVVSD